MANTAFPYSRATWSPFVRQHASAARAAGVVLPNFSQYKIVIGSRVCDVFSDLRAAQKWWTHARLDNDLLTSMQPRRASIVDACRHLLIDQKSVPLLVKYLRCDEILNGYKNFKPRDWFKGTHRCPKCHKCTVPICYKKPTSDKCVNMDCRQIESAAEAKKKRKQHLREVVRQYLKTRIVKKSCCKCQCSIRCREDELKPRANEHTGLLQVSLCYRHRFIKTEAQWMMRQPANTAAESEDCVIICRACNKLAPHKCRFCKCYFKGGAGVCDKCRNKIEIAIPDVPKKDKSWRGVCKVCAESKRGGRKKWSMRIKGDFNLKHSKLWKRVSVEVREMVEWEFRKLQAWLQEGKKNPMALCEFYRRIERNTGWITCDDGDLRIHYHNWGRKKENK